MKKIFLAMSVIAMSLAANAQQAYDGSIKVSKVDEPAVIIDYNYPKDVVEAALKSKLADYKLKGKTSKGAINFNGATISDIANAPFDYSFRMDESGRKDKKVTKLYMIIKGSNALGVDPAQMSANAKSFLNNLVGNVDKTSTVFDIKKQEEILVKEEKTLKGFQDEQSKLEKKLESLKKDQEKQSRVIESQKLLIQDLRNKL